MLDLRGLSPQQVINLMEKLEYINQFNTHQPYWDSSKNLWSIRVEGGKKKTAKTKEDLIDKLYLYYGGCNDFSFFAIYELAKNKHQEDAGNCQDTANKLDRSFKRYINEEFAKKDVRSLKSSDIDTYINKWLIQYQNESGKPLRKQAFYDFKGIFNLVFKYCCEGDIPILSRNPVPQDNTKYLKKCYTPHKTPEEKAFQPEDIKKIKKICWTRLKTSNNYVVCINALAVLLAIETGMRMAELCAFKWDDVQSKLHIHAQILSKDEKEHTFFYAEWTKNEKGHSKGGRYFPQSKKIRQIMQTAKELQKKHNVKSEFVFARKNGNWMTPDDYRSALRKITQKAGVTLSNNHAFRIALNSYVLIPMGLAESERAKLLGHSVKVNLEHYTYPLQDFSEDIEKKFDEFYSGTESAIQPVAQPVAQIIDFTQKKRTLEASKIKGSQ